MKLRLPLSFLAAVMASLGFATTCSTSSASNISINFGSSNAVGSDQTAGAYETDGWINTNQSSGTLALGDTGASVTITSRGGNWQNSTSITNSGTQNNSGMMYNYLDDGSGREVSLTFSGLSYGSYDLYIYMNTDSGNGKFSSETVTTTENGEQTSTGKYYGDGVTTVKSDSDSNTTWGKSTGINSLEEGQNYLKVSDLSGDGLTISGVFSSGVSRSTISGIQIVEFNTLSLDASALDTVAWGESLWSQGSETNKAWIDATAEVGSRAKISGKTDGTTTVTIAQGSEHILQEIWATGGSLTFGTTSNDTNGQAKLTILSNGLIKVNEGASLSMMGESGVTFSGLDTLNSIQVGSNAHYTTDQSITAKSLYSAGNLSLTGSNNSIDVISLSGGVSTLKNMTSESITLSNDAQLTYDGTTGSVTMGGTSSLTMNGTVSGSLSLSGSTANIVLSGTHSVGTINLIDAGTLSLTGSTTVSNLLSVKNGNLNLTGSLTTNQIRMSDTAGGGNGSITIGAGGVLTVTGTVNNKSSNDSFLLGHWGSGGKGTLTLQEGGKLISTGANMYLNWDGTGTFNMTGGEAQLKGINATGNWGTYGSVNISGGSLAIGDGGLVSSRTNGASFNLGKATISVADSATGWSSAAKIALTSSEGTTFNVAQNKKITLSGVLSNDSAEDASAGKLVKDGEGELILSGTNTYTGGTEVHQGSLVVNNGASLSTGGVTVNQGGTLTVGSDPATIINLDLQAGSLTLNGGSILNLSGSGTSFDSITTTGGFLTDATTENKIILNLELTGGVNNGDTVNLITVGSDSTIDASLFELKGFEGTRFSGSNLSWSNGSLVLNLVGSGSNLVWNGSDGQMTWDSSSSNWKNGETSDSFHTLDNVTFGDTGAGTVLLEGNISANVVTVDSTQDYTFAGDGSLVAGSLVKDNTGTLTLTKGNSYAEGTTINGGTISVQETTALGVGSVVINEGGTLDLKVGIANALSGAGALIVDFGTSTEGVVNAASFSGAVTLTSGIASMAVNGLSNATSVSFNGGSLKLTSSGTISGTLAATEGHQILIDHNGNKITLNASSTSGDIYLKETASRGATSSAYLSFTNMGDYAGTIYTADLTAHTVRSERCDIKIGGSGTSSTLGQANLVVGENSNLCFYSNGQNWTSSTSTITLKDGVHVYGYNPEAQTFGVYHNFKLAGNVSFGGFTYGNNAKFYGSIEGQGNLTFSNALNGTTVWSNLFGFRDGWVRNSYQGNTSVALDVLYDLSSTLSSDTTAITPFGIYAKDDTGVTSGKVTLKSGTTQISGHSSLSHAVALNNAVQFDGGNFTLSSWSDLDLTKDVIVSQDGTLTFTGNQQNSALTLSGDLSGSADLTLTTGRSDSAEVNFANTATNFTGNIHVGTSSKAVHLNVNKAGALGTGTVDLANNDSSITLNQTDTISNVISGSGQVIKGTSGTNTTLSGANTYTGNTIVNQGTLTVGSDNALGTGQVFVKNGTLDAGDHVLGNSTLTVQGGTLSNFDISKASETLKANGIVVDLIPTNDGAASATLNDVKGALVAGDSGSLLKEGESLTITGSSDLVLNNVTFTLNQDGELFANTSSLFNVSEGSHLTLTGTLTFDISSWGSMEDGTTGVIDFATLAKDMTLNVEGLTDIIIIQDGKSLSFNWGESGYVDAGFESAKSQLSTTGKVTFTIPEPSTATLTLLAMMGLMARRRRTIQA